MSTSILDVIVLTVVATLLVGIIGYYLVKCFRSGWAFMQDFLKVLREVAAIMCALEIHLICLKKTIKAIYDELTYMRSMTQPSPNFGQTDTPQPPLGHAGVMPGPPPFPSPVWDRYAPPAPDATLEDTPMELIEQDDKDMSEAQALEYLRSKGIEPDEGDEPQPAVIDEA